MHMTLNLKIYFEQEQKNKKKDVQRNKRKQNKEKNLKKNLLALRLYNAVDFDVSARRRLAPDKKVIIFKIQKGRDNKQKNTTKYRRGN